MGLCSSVTMSCDKQAGIRTPAPDLPRGLASVPRSRAVESHPVRADKVRAIREQLAKGTYNIDEHLDAVVEKVLDAIAVRTARSKTGGRTRVKTRGRSIAPPVVITSVFTPGRVCSLDPACGAMYDESQEGAHTSGH